MIRFRAARPRSAATMGRKRDDVLAIRVHNNCPHHTFCLPQVLEVPNLRSTTEVDDTARAPFNVPLVG